MDQALGKEKQAQDDAGGLSLNQKMIKLRESLGENPDIAAAMGAYKAGTSKLDKSKLWQKAQTEMKHNPALKEAYEAAPTKGAQGKVLTAWSLDPDGTAGIFKTVTASLGTKSTVMQASKWVGYSKLLQDWTDTEIEAHLKSGRFASKEDPDTPGVWIYKDQKDISQLKQIEKTKRITGAQQQEIEDEEVDVFQALYDSCCLGLSEQSFEMGNEAWSFGTIAGKGGKGKGKHVEIRDMPFVQGGSQKGSGQGKGKAAVEITLETANSKGKQALNLVQKTALTLEEDRAKVKASSYWNKKIGAQFSSHESDLEDFAKNLKKALVSEMYASNMEAFKKLLASAVMCVKGFNDFKKEHANISSAASVKADDE